MRFLPIVLLMFVILGCGSEPQPVNEVEPQEEAIAAIEKLSGKVKFDVNSPDYPVIEVFFNNTSITDQNLVHLKGFTKLQSLSLWHTKITDVGLEHLKELTNLRTLTLDATRVTDTGLEHLKGLTKLQGLYLFRTKVTDSGLAHLKGLTKLKELDLTNTKVTDLGLAHLKGLTKLQNLDLTNTKVTDKGVQMLQTALPKCHIAGFSKKSIVSLTDQEKQAIAAIKKLGGRVRYNTFKRKSPNRKVIEVNFGHFGPTTGATRSDARDPISNVTDDGLEHLKGLTKLQRLSLSSTEITDAGLKYLKGLTELSYLGLRGTEITDAGLEHLKGLIKLQRLCLIDTNVTDEGVEKLQTALPNCDISHKAPLPSLLLPGTEVTTSATVPQLTE